MKRLETTYHPSLYEINTRVWLGELSRAAGRPLTLAEVPEEALEQISAFGFDLVWLMGVFTTGEVGRSISLQIPSLRRAYQKALPDWTEADVIGSPYAVQSYHVSQALGGPEALAVLRERLARRGIGLILDFVPNHTARDHLWVYEHPEFYVQGTKDDLERDPESFFLAHTRQGERVIAMGRDPYFPAWTDTAQLNYRHPETRRAMRDTLCQIAGLCDGVRCDMSMLLLNEVFLRTWGERARVEGVEEAKGEFWAEAIDAVRQKNPGFLMIAEAYWDLEWRLLSLGFDYTYDKRLLDRLHSGEAGPVRAHLSGDMEYQERQVRFLENHDETRARAAFSPAQQRAAAVIAATSPGMRFFHEGELEGRTLHLPVQLGRRHDEPVDEAIRGFYQTLLETIHRDVFRRGKPRLLTPVSAWPGDSSFEQFILWRWAAKHSDAALVAVNFGPHRARCRVPLQLCGIESRTVLLIDRLSEERYERDGTEMVSVGLYLDMAPWQAAIYDLVIKRVR